MKPPSKNWFTITQIEPGVNSEHVLLLERDFWPFFGASGNLVWQSKSGGKPLAELGKKYHVDIPAHDAGLSENSAKINGLKVSRSL